MAMGVDVEQKEHEQEGIMNLGSLPDSVPFAEPSSTPSSPPLLPGDSSALPGDAASKRQRRPNVRLNEIGSESSLANVVEYLLKRKGGRGVVGGKRGARNNKHTSPISAAAATASMPGKFSKKPKLSPKFKSDGDDGDDVLHHAAEDSKSPTSKPFDKQNLTPKGRKRKVGLGKSRFPDHTIGTAIAKHAKHPKVIYPHPPEGNGNNWMHKAMTGVADGFLEAADGCVYGASDTDKRAHSPSPHSQPANFGFESGSPKGFRKAQGTTKRKKKVSSGPKAPPATGYARKDKGEKEEPSSSDLQELRLQGPVWERGVPPLDDKVREWIQGIGLEKYASVFQHHEVGDDVVPLLTLEDLKEMGINAVGARRKFFSEITKRKQGLVHADEPLAEEK
eukprot:c19954_g1_i1 orf=309-1484(-)